MDVGDRAGRREAGEQADLVKLPAVRALRPGLHLLETEVEDFDVRAAVVVGTERAVLFDTLAHPAQMADVAGLVGLVGLAGSVGGLPVAVVYSHADWDHCWGTCGVSGVDAVLAQEAALGRFRTDVPEELARRLAADPERWGAVTLVPPTVTFQDRHVLDLGGATLELHALPGHTPDCLVGWIPEWGVLLAGDTVETPLPVVNDGESVEGWIDGLARWAGDASVTTVVPSHGRVGGREVVADTLRYLRGLRLGEGPADVAALTPFYRETHRRNLELARRG